MYYLSNVVEKSEDGSKGESRDKDCNETKLKKWELDLISMLLDSTILQFFYHGIVLPVWPFQGTRQKVTSGPKPAACSPVPTFKQSIKHLFLSKMEFRFK